MNRRTGFSLVEILVVISIMAIVIGLLLAAMGPTLAAGRIGSTQATIAKLSSIVLAQAEKINTRPLKSEARTFAMSYSGGGNSPAAVPESVAEVYLRKIEYRSTFPQRLEDLYGLDGTPNTPDDAYLLSVWLSKTGGALFPTGHQRKHESAKLLYLAMVASNQTITDTINNRHIAFLDPNDKAMDLPAFVDDWGNALRFYNWPTRLVRPGGAGSPINQNVYNVTAKPLIGLAIPDNPSPLPYVAGTTQVLPVFQDPTDPQLRLTLAVANGTFAAPFGLRRYQTTYKRAASIELGTPPGPAFACAPLNESNLHTPATWHKPLIVSCGEDGELGLEEPTAAGFLRLAMPKTNAEDVIADNLTNLQKN